MNRLMRHWRRSPAYATTIMMVVALVVAANAAAFSVVWGALYKPLPYRDAQELVELRIDLRDIDFQVGLSHGMYEQLRQSDDTFAGVIGSAEAWQPRLDGNGIAWRVQRITPDFNQVLGVAPAIGRALAASGDRELLLSDRIWRSRFGGARDVLGRQLQIGSEHYSVIGVMPAGFGWPDSEADAWTRHVATTSEREQELAGGFGVFHVAARLAPGATRQQALDRLESAMRNAGSSFLRDHPDTARPDLRPWRERFTSGVLQPLLALQAAALLLLVVATANIGNLTVERVTSRAGDFAVRRALGARWSSLMRAIMADLLPPTLLGSATGLLLAFPVLALARTRGLLPDAMLAPDGFEWPLLFAGMVAACIVLLGGTAAGVIAAIPNLRSTPGTLQTQRQGSLRAGMLVTQIALATALCGSAGLLLRSALALQSEPRGFDAAGVLLTQVDLSSLAHDGNDADSSPMVASAMARLRQVIAQQPGVTHQSLASMPPFGKAEFKTTVLPPGIDQPVDVRFASVGSDYFQAMGMPLLAGEALPAQPSSDIVPVVVDESFRQHWLTDTDSLGSILRLTDGDEATTVARVVGIVPTVKQQALTEYGKPMLYMLLEGTPAITFLVTRTAGDPAALSSVIQRELQQIAPDAVLMFNQPLAAAIEASTAIERSLTEVVLLFGASTGLLCVLGCFAVVGALANRRRAEVGLRMAMGASPGRIRQLVIRQGAMPIVAGVSIGVLTGVLLARAFADRLFRISADDAGTWLLAATLIATLALLACWLPAIRAASLSPTTALAAGNRRI